MALSIDEANAVSKKWYDKVIMSQVYDSSPFLAKLKQKNKVVADGGSSLQWPIRYKESGTTIATGPRSQLAYTQVETRTGATDDWKYYANHALISWDERVKNSGDARVINLLKDKYKEAQDDFAEKLADDLFASSQGTYNLTPLTVIVDSATTYAGIAVADAANWASAEDSSTTRLVLYGSSGSLSYMINAATLGNSGPNFIVTTRNLFSKAESLIEPQKRYEDTETANIGFANVKFHGTTIVSDGHCPTGYMYGLDLGTFELKYHPEFNFNSTDWKSLEQAGFPSAMVKVITWAGNLTCNLRKTNFKYSALDYTA